MRKTLIVSLFCAAAGALCVAAGWPGEVPPGLEFSRTWAVNCDQGRRSLTDTIERARAGDTIIVKGECHEALTIDKPLTLDGEGSARVVPPEPSDTAFTVTGRDVTVRGFQLDAPALFQFFVFGSAKLTIESNLIRNASNFGISVAANSDVTVLDNVISDNQYGGIIGLSGARLAIGTVTSFEPPRPNVIAGNARVGLVLISNATAMVVGGNTISGHQLGLLVQDGGQARVAGNVIADNDIGLFVDAGGNVQLPVPSNPVPLFVELNQGENRSLGIACKGGSIAGIAEGLAPAVKLPPNEGILSGPSDGLATHCLDQTVPPPADG